MSKYKSNYDWAQASLSLHLCASQSFTDLVEAADLDPIAGDLIDVDLSGLDLRNQNMRGWNLKYANFEGAKISGANLVGAALDARLLIGAVDWPEAELSAESRVSALFYQIQSIPVANLPLSVSTSEFLGDLGIRTIEDLFYMREYDMIVETGLETDILVMINELREVLDDVNLKFIQSDDNEPNSSNKADFGRHWIFLHPDYDDDESVFELQEHVQVLLAPFPKTIRRAAKRSKNIKFDGILDS